MRLWFLYTPWCLILILYCLKFLNKPNIFQSLIWRVLLDLNLYKIILYPWLWKLRGFLGITGYCHIWIPGYGELGGGLVTKSCWTLATPWTVAYQAPLSMGFFRQEFWGGLPFPSLGDLPNPGIKPRSPALQADSLPTELSLLMGKILLYWLLMIWAES